jgi:hypothetical protein
MKNFNDTIGNGNRDLPVCSAVTLPTALRQRNSKLIFGIWIRVVYSINYYLYIDPNYSLKTNQMNN